MKSYFMHSFGSICKAIWRLVGYINMCTGGGVLNQQENVKKNFKNFLFMQFFVAMICFHIYYSLLFTT